VQKKQRVATALGAQLDVKHAIANGYGRFLHNIPFYTSSALYIFSLMRAVRLSALLQLTGRPMACQLSRIMPPSLRFGCF
jgi:hypothetical protein